MNALHTLVKALRDPDTGCPWDQRQTFTTIAPYTIEEAYEVQDAIEREDWNELRSELGDLLFQVVFHAQMASEQGLFDFGDVVNGIVEKMHRRHPHVFGNAKERATEAPDWETLKRAEREHQNQEPKSVMATSIMDGIAQTLPALKQACKVQQRAATVGFDWPDIEGVCTKVREELSEVITELENPKAAPTRIADEVGDLLFSCINLARHLNVNPETALSQTVKRFKQRFRWMEREAMKSYQSQTSPQILLSSLDQHSLENLWECAKAAEQSSKISESFSAPQDGVNF